MYSWQRAGIAQRGVLLIRDLRLYPPPPKKTQEAHSKGEVYLQVPVNCLPHIHSGLANQSQQESYN